MYLCLRIFLRRFFSTLDIRQFSLRGESRFFELKLQDTDRFPVVLLDLIGSPFLYCGMRRFFQDRIFARVLFATAILSVAIGCSSKTVQYPEDHERYLRIDKAVESLRQSYVKRDLSGMASVMVPMEQTDRLQRDAEGDFEAYQDIALEFRVERIMIDGDDIDVYVHWQGLWKKNADDPGLRQRGHTRFQWVGTKYVLLRGVQGDSPFGMKARQTTGGQQGLPPKK